MPMIDYNEDGDIPMVASSSENWLQPLSHMDEDVHHFDPSPQEVDMMMAYEEATTEYDMEDDAAQPSEAAFDTNLVDAELYDATIHSSPLPPATAEIAETHSAQSGAPVVPDASVEQRHVDEQRQFNVTLESESSLIQRFTTSDATRTLDNSSAGSETQHPDYTSTSGVVEPVDEHQSAVPEQSEGYSLAPPQPFEDMSNDAGGTVNETPSEHLSTHPQVEGSEEHSSVGHTDKPPDPPVEADSELTHNHKEVTENEHFDDEANDQEPHAEDGEENDDAAALASEEQPELHTTQLVHAQPPPPPILLSLQVTSTEGDQPDFVLFNLPEVSSHTTEEPLVLLQHHPSLFYEPISAVFDAFRQEEYFSHLEEISEAEMAINAHELQLVISEDNVYSREVSLQDLYAMHQGVGLPGHLRLTLQSIVPRFIVRYNVLRDQITRLVLGEEPEEVQQGIEDSIGDNEEHELQAQLEGAPQEGPEHEEQDLDSTKQAEIEEHDREGQDLDKNDELQNADDALAETGVEESTERHTEEAEPGVITNVEQSELEHEAQRPLEAVDDEPEENDGAADVLDADAVHPFPPDDAEPALDEHEIEYADVTEPREEDEEGYEDELKQDEEDNIAPAVEEDPSAISSAGAELNTDSPAEQKPTSEADDARHGVISQSVSTSSFGTDDTSWEVGLDEGEELGNTKQETDHSEQQTAANVFDEEGNLAGAEDELDGFGDDDFGDDEFDESAEGTLDDVPEETQELTHDTISLHEQEDADADSRAVLAESEKFVSELATDGDNFGNTNEELAEDEQQANEVFEAATSKHSTVAEAASNEPMTVHKNRSKRSLDDAEFDDEDFVSPPSSPNSKRTRTL